MNGAGGSAVTSEAAVAALFEVLDVIVARAPGAWWRPGTDGTRLLVSGTQLATFNGIFSSEPVPDVAAVAELAPSVIASGLPWSIFSRAEPSAELVAVAAEHGLTRAHRSPVMVRGTEPVRRAPGGRDTPVIRLITAADLEIYTDVLTAGFEAPPEMLRNLMSPELINAPEISAYLVEHHGEPVAVGLGTVTAGLVGVYNIATPQRFRSRGYGRLVTEAVIRDGFAAGARGAYLLASGLGQPLYHSLGFETIDTWTYLMS